jgi:hypothetical protein
MWKTIISNIKKIICVIIIFIFIMVKSINDKNSIIFYYD